MALTPEEKVEFNTLKRELLEYHQLGCTHHNPKKERYNELWDKNAQGVLKALDHFNNIASQMEQN